MSRYTSFIPSRRIVSVDIFRALIMFLMIFVNDFWSLINVPHWLEHANSTEDMLGFSDFIFPAFLFAVGLSIPLSVENRIKKGDYPLTIILHIVIRSFSLIVIGLLTVNIEVPLAQDMIFSRPQFIILMLTGIFLIWNIYPESKSKITTYLFILLRVIGVLLLVFLIWKYKDADGGIFQKRWWGILGLIGWTYLVCSIIYLFLRHSRILLLVVSLLLIVICIEITNGWWYMIEGVMPGEGCFHAITMSGLLLSLFLNQPVNGLSNTKKIQIASIGGVLLIVAGIISRNFWIISKVQATPTWMFICSGISVILYVIIYWLIDIRFMENAFTPIKTAGTATLTCYLVPYLFYAIFELTDFTFPIWMITFPIGLLKSILFAFVVIWFTKLLGKMGIKLKL